MRATVKGSLIALGVIGTASVPAFAAPVSDRPSITVLVSAPDLASASGVEGLTRKIESAARRVCKEESRSDVGYLFARACYVTAMQDAVAELERLRGGKVTSFATSAIVIAAR